MLAEARASLSPGDAEARLDQRKSRARCASGRRLPREASAPRTLRLPACAAGCGPIARPHVRRAESDGLSARARVPVLPRESAPQPPAQHCGPSAQRTGSYERLRTGAQWRSRRAQSWRAFNASATPHRVAPTAPETAD